MAGLAAGLLCTQCYHGPGKLEGEVPDLYIWDCKLVTVNGRTWERNNLYEDSLIRADFALRPNLVAVKLTNKSRGLMQLRWKRSTFKMPGEDPSSITHSELEYEDRNKTPADRVLVPTKPHKFYMAPSVRAEWNGQSRRWRSYPILKGLPEELTEQLFTLNFTLAAGGDPLKYAFTFQVEETSRIRKLEYRIPKGLSPPENILKVPSEAFSDTTGGQEQKGLKP